MSEKYSFKTREDFRQWLLSNYMQDMEFGLSLIKL